MPNVYLVEPALTALYGLAAASYALACVGLAVWTGSRAGRNAAASELVRLDQAVRDSEVKTADLRDHALELLERTAQERARVVAQATRAQRRTTQDGDNGQNWTEERYRAHLEGGGAALPDVERSLGI